jgi:peptidoglycan/xylan/chitin deacetylase (PgdA/CDA1 family)
MKTIALRIDDIGASTKRFEVYSKKRYGNFLFLKYVKNFKAWGPYREMSVDEWNKVFSILRQFGAKLTVGVTAAWVERNGKLTYFPEKFPEEAMILKNGLNEGLIEIANHGLTHCVVGKHLPKLFTSNRYYHREFWVWIPRNIHFENVKRSQEILQDYFDVAVTTMIPPGNVFSDNTVQAAKKYGIKRINYRRMKKSMLKEIILSLDSKITSEKNLPLENIIRFHDREIVTEGVDWLSRKLKAISAERQFVFVRDL